MGGKVTSQRFSLETVPLATFLEFQRVSELTLATNEASAMPGDSSIPSGVVSFFQKGWKKYYVDTRIVSACSRSLLHQVCGSRSGGRAF